MKRTIFTLAKFLVSAALLIGVIYFVGIGTIVGTIRTIPPALLLLAILSIAANIALGAVNILLLVRSVRKDVPFGKLLRYYLTSWSIGLFVPGKIGEFSIIAYLKKYRISATEGIVLSIADKAITFLMLSFFSLIGIYMLFPGSGIYVLLTCMALGFIGLSFVLSEYGEGIVRKLLPKRLHAKYGEVRSAALLIIRSPRYLAFNFLLTLIKWLMTGVTFFLILQALGQNIPLMWVIIIYSTTIIISLIPISLSGLGVKEGAAYVMFSQFAVDSGAATSAYVLFTILGYLLAVIAIALAPKE